MHVIIARLTADPVPARNIDEDDVYLRNESAFPNGVSYRTGEDRDDDIDRVIQWFGDAARSGTETADGKTVRWIEIDGTKTDSLFRERWDKFQDIKRALSTFDFGDFMSGYRIPNCLSDLRSAYDFDDIYIVDENGYSETVAHWIRFSVISGARLYFQETYDGGQ